MKKNKYVVILTFACMISLLGYSISAKADGSNPKDRGISEREKAESGNKKNEEKVKWEIHKSISKIFEIKFPQKYKYKIFPFQFNKNTVAFAVEIKSSLDGINAKKREKSISVKAYQTFGEELSYTEAKRALNYEVERYKQATKFLNGTILTNEDIKHEGFIGKNIYISYKVKGEKYGLRIMLYMTNYSKVELTLSGPSNTLYSFRSDDFFDSIKLLDGITKKESPIGVGWIDYTSHNNIFTAVLPPKNSIYTPNTPKFIVKPKVESMRFKIYDPILEKNLIYNVYSYISDKKFTQKKVKTILFSKHISVFVKSGGPESIRTENTIVDGVIKMKTKLIVSPTKNNPYITTLFYEARFKNNILVIQEVLSSTNHARSGLNKTLFSQLKFHPKKYKPVGIKKPANKKDEVESVNKKAETKQK